MAATATAPRRGSTGPTAQMVTCCAAPRCSSTGVGAESTAGTAAPGLAGMAARPGATVAVDAAHAGRQAALRQASIDPIEHDPPLACFVRKRPRDSEGVSVALLREVTSQMHPELQSSIMPMLRRCGTREEAHRMEWKLALMAVVHAESTAPPALLLRLESAERKETMDRFVTSLLCDTSGDHDALRAGLASLIEELKGGAPITREAVVAELAKFAAFCAPNYWNPEAALKAMAIVPDGFDPLVHLFTTFTIPPGLLSRATLEVALVAYGVCGEWRRAVLDPRHSLCYAAKAALVVLAYTWHGYTIPAPRTVDDVVWLEQPYLGDELDAAILGVFSFRDVQCHGVLGLNPHQMRRPRAAGPLECGNL